MTWAVLPASVYAPFARPAYTCHNNRWTLGGTYLPADFTSIFS